MNAYIIKKPVITEKTLQLANKQNVYTFEVSKIANKNQVSQAVEKVFKVNVIAVNTVMRSTNKKRTGRRRLQILMPKTKKVMVKIKNGQTIDLFDLSGEKKATKTTKTAKTIKK